MSRHLLVCVSYLFFCFIEVASPAQTIDPDSLAQAYFQVDSSEQNKVFHKLKDNPQQVIAVAKEIVSQASKRGVPDTLIEVYYGLANAYYEVGYYDSADQTINRALAIFRQYPEKQLQQADLLNLAGVVYDLQGRYDEAIKRYHEALAIWEEQESLEGQSRAYLNIGNIYSFQKEYYRAIDHYEKSLEISQAIQDTINIVYLYSNIGMIWGKHLDSLDLAMNYYQRSLYWAKQHDDEGVTATPLYGITHIQIERGQLDDALANANYLLDLAKRQQYTNDELYAWQLLARVRWAHQEQKAAIRAATEAYNLAIASQAPREIIMSGELLAKYYSDLGEFEKAFKYQAVQIAYKDSIYSVEKSKIISNLERTRDDTRIKMLEKDNALKKAQISEREAVIDRQMVYSIATSVVALLLLSGLLFLYKTNKQRKKVSMQLSAQKEQIAKSNEQLTQMNDKLRQHQQQLQDQNKDLVRLNSLKNKLLSIISHDFRSPLSSLQGIITVLNSNALSPKEIEQVFESLSSKVENTTNMLDNLLKWTRNQMQGIRVEPEHFTLTVLVKEVISSQLILAEKKEINLYCNINSALTAYADPEMVRLVVRNLVSNAIKFTSKGDSITIEAFLSDNKVTVSVIDTGIGMSSEDLDKLFQLKEHTTYGTNNEKGTGLGLILCQEFVEANGGKIWVESTLAKGTTFFFTLLTDPDQFPEEPTGQNSDETDLTDSYKTDPVEGQ